MLAGSFVFGIAFGAWLNGEANFQPNNVASTEIVDRKTPSGAVCMANGYSSMVSSTSISVVFFFLFLGGDKRKENGRVSSLIAVGI